MRDGVGLNQHRACGRERVKKPSSTGTEYLVIAVVLHDGDHDVIEARNCAHGAPRRLRCAKR
jgi:hypothetical protein